MPDSTTTRRDLMGLLALGGAGLAAIRPAQADSDEGPCPELLDRPFRVIGPNSAVTMDYNPDRVNIYHDDENVITKITFG
jgi:hypothetical protein